MAIYKINIYNEKEENGKSGLKKTEKEEKKKIPSR